MYISRLKIVNCGFSTDLYYARVTLMPYLESPLRASAFPALSIHTNSRSCLHIWIYASVFTASDDCAEITTPWVRQAE